MKVIIHHWRAAVRVVAAILFLCAGGIAYVWWYQMAPWLRTQDPAWVFRHSGEGYWHEVRTSIERWGWTHEDGFRAGEYGDAEFMAWVMARTSPDDDISSCFVGHQDGAFRMITNQDVGEQAAAWLVWWESNKSKSQEEWIQDGFAAAGVQVALPPSQTDIIRLLALLGRDESGEAAESSRYLKYNAFRWLRDSDFNPVAFAIANPTSAAEPQVEAGLLEYLNQERRFPKRDYAGVLRFGAEDNRYSEWSYPAIALPYSRRRVNALIFGLFFVAAALLLSTASMCHRQL